MGLRERASDYSKDTQNSRGIDLGLELRPDLNKPRPAASPATGDDSPVRKETRKPTTTTVDFPETQGHKSRLDSMLNLIEIYKEFGQVRSAADLWQVIAYSLMAQLGTKSIAIFMEDDTRMELKHALGYTLSSDHSFAANNKLCTALAKERKPLLVDDLLPALSEREVKFLGSLGARYAAPVFRYEELRGVILINPPQGSSFLGHDDLFYLKICGELLGAMEAQLKLVAGAEARNADLNRWVTFQEYAANFVTRLGALDNHESLRDALEDEISRHYAETAYLLMTREDFFLRRHFAAGFPPDKVNNLEVNLVDSIIEKIKKGQTVFAPADFETSEGFAFLGGYRQIHAHKVLHRQEILAVCFVAESDKEKITALFSMTDHYVMQNHVAKLRDHATHALKHADNPVMAIRNFIGACEEYVTKSDEPYAVIVTSIMNYKRLENLHGDSYAAEIRDFTRKTLREIMEAQDFSTEAFHGHFVSVLRQKEAGDAWRLSRILQKQAGKAYPDEDRRPIYQHKIYARPHIQSIPFELLFKS